MNRRIILLTIIMALVLAVPVAWAGDDHVRTDRQVSHRDLSPAEFFGYTGADAGSGGAGERAVRGEDEKGADDLTNADTGNKDLSPAEFFGYANPNSATAAVLTDVKGPVKETAVNRCCSIDEDLKHSGSVYDNLSPAVFFYDYPSVNRNIDPCQTC